jgi:DNA-binding PadR family transcriptional regulator
LLHGLERRGYLRSKERLVDGKIRRIYSITKRGQDELVHAAAKVRELYEELVEGHGEPSPAHPKGGGEGHSASSQRLSPRAGRGRKKLRD